MVFLNGKFIDKNQALVSVMDRGFLFGDGVYEVIPVYQKKMFCLQAHLQRLQNSLDAVKINNPYDNQQWHTILSKIVEQHNDNNQSLYLQVTRGADTQRQHSFDILTPSVFAQSTSLTVKTEQILEKGFSAISDEDIRWHRCDIKSISLLGNIMYAQNAKIAHAEEVVLHRNQIITEGATSNIFIVKDNALFTHPVSKNILTGVTRDLVLKSAQNCKLTIHESIFSLTDTYQADELWISSSTRELMPIVKLDQQPINQGIVGPKWRCVYHQYQQLKNAG